jgi:putative DNA primase/helicase
VSTATETAETNGQPTTTDAEQFLEALFQPGDRILFRPIETWTENGQKKSQVDYQGVQYQLVGTRGQAEQWQPVPGQLATAIKRHNERSEQTKCNIFFGVCPRFGGDGKFDQAWQIRVVRVLWMDVDHCTVEEARDRCKAAGLPEPSIIVASGNGAHLYWILTAPHLIDDVDAPLPVFTEFIDQGEGKKKKARKFLKGTDGAKAYIDGKGAHNAPSLSPKAQHVQDILAGIAAKIDGDHAIDLSRLLRVPGTLNRKDQRNGREPVPCRLVECRPERRYAIAEFAKYAEASPDRARRETIAKVKLPTHRRLPARSRDKFQELLLACGAAQIGTRSDTDYALCCWAIEHGMTKEEVWAEAQQVGKFVEGGERYFARTWAKAEDHTREQIYTKVERKAARGRAKPSGNGRAAAGSEDGTPSLLFPVGRTEVANALRLAKKHGVNVRWCDPWGKFLVWDGRRWAVDQECRADALAKDIFQSLWDEIAALGRSSEVDDELKELLRFAKQTGTAHGIEAMLKLVRSEPGIAISPNALDTDPWSFNVANGTIDLRTGKLRPHRREDRMTKLCPVTYDPAADCPMWLRFLGDVTAGDTALQRYLRKAAGCSLTGDTREHVLFFLYGTGANGKSTFVNTVLEMMGPDYAMKAPPDLLLVKSKDAHPTERADLAGKRFVACIEADEGKRLAEALVKELTGNDPLRARHMREDFWQFQPTHKVWLAANHKPIIRGTDLGIWRRIKLIPFIVTLPDDKQDKGLQEKLRAELAGILNWALLGCIEWQAEGLAEPQAVASATSGYRRQQDVLGGFLEECCVVAPDVRARAGDLLAAYRHWSGDDRMTQRRLGETLTERGFDTAMIGGYAWRIGIGLREDKQPPASL